MPYSRSVQRKRPAPMAAAEPASGRPRFAMMAAAMTGMYTASRRPTALSVLLLSVCNKQTKGGGGYGAGKREVAGPSEESAHEQAILAAVVARGASKEGKSVPVIEAYGGGVGFANHQGQSVNLSQLQAAQGAL